MANRRNAAPGWHQEDIKAALRKRYGKLVDLAASWGLHRAAVSNAIARPESSAVEMRIADALGVTPHTLWPDRWTQCGVRRPTASITSDRSRSAPIPHRPNSEAA